MTGDLKSHTTTQPSRVLPVLLWFVIAVSFFLTLYQGYHPPQSTEYPADFAIFRTAVEMIRAGSASDLYNVNMQKQFFSKIVGPSFTQFLVWNHPPVEALIYAPFGSFGYEEGLAIMKVLNSILFASIVLWTGFSVRSNPDALFILGIVFFLSMRPFAGTIATGQDSIWILLAFLIALVSLHNRHYFAASVLLGLASIKFTILLPLLFVLFLVGFRSTVLHAILVAALIWLVPIVFWGFDVFTSFVRLCIELPSVNDQWGIHAGLLWNFRGILVRLGIEQMRAIWVSVPIGFVCALCVKALPPRFILPSALMISTFFSPHIYQHDALMYAGSLILLIRISLVPVKTKAIDRAELRSTDDR